MKRCPFCGNDSATIFGKVCYKGYTFTIYWAECEVCGAKTKAFSESKTDELDFGCNAVIRAVDAWERRATNAG